MHNKIDVVIMAGGKGNRLKPLTEHTPKALLKVGNKSIIEYNIDLLLSYGVQSINISVHHLCDTVISYFKDNSKIEINFIKEEKPLGTIGALKLFDAYKTDNILVMNADLLTNLNVEQLVNNFLLNEADASIATVPFQISLPHDIVEKEKGKVTRLKEKHSIAYNLNAGIYMFKKACLKYIPQDSFFNATDLINALIDDGKKIISYPIREYWLDIGQHEDYKKAQEAVKHIKF
ncbi:sugar phosphate nucleotidyltransferase [uncultured Winogradskyella sp.]|uniref:sugar phosphate nucleotidyltransferase n=1 Tax=uncultured Winogradskyella sp. TaxID=395353 RepID=UPI0026030B6F|nr:sugar phosphate nucleotidyltransferase [uncultured Winogradskyella sp.]